MEPTSGNVGATDPFGSLFEGFRFDKEKSAGDEQPKRTLHAAKDPKRPGGRGGGEGRSFVVGCGVVAQGG
jgi:hypothetical protein